MKRVLVSGYYGFNNAGDEAVLAGLTRGLRGRMPPDGLEITALSIHPHTTRSLHNILARHRYKALLSSIAKTDLLLSGGGSLLQDITSKHGIFYYLAVVRIAQLLGKKSMFVAQGIGPLLRQSSRKLTASVARRLDAITVRDRASEELLRSIGVTGRIDITADPALLLTPTRFEPASNVLLSLRTWPGMSGHFAEDLAEALTQNSLQDMVQPLNMHGRADAVAAGDVLGILDPSSRPVTSAPPLNYQELLDQVAASKMLIGMRLHALIFAATAGVPMVALSYDPKVDAFMEQLGQGDAVITVESSSKDVLRDVVGTVWRDRHHRVEAVREMIPALRILAERNIEIVQDLLK